MNSFEVVYRFVCPNCKHIGVGTQVFQANTADEASRMLSTVVLPCTVCHQTVECDVTAKTYVFQSAQPSIPDSATGPAVPLT